MTDGIDPVTFEVIWHRLLDITEEMGIKYMRTSGSPILVGAYDASTGITLPDGRLVAIGPYITTQAHVLPLIIGSTKDRCTRNPGIRSGDMFICNDPYLGATHQPDVATVAPVMHEEETVAWVGASGHWIDIGGPEPGGFNMNARSVFDEGLRMSPTRIVERSEVREDILGLIVNQMRDPMAELDLRGQIVANHTGSERIVELCQEFGAPVVTNVMTEAIAHVERRLRSRLRELPNGVWREVQLIDHDGHRPTLRRIVCTITKTADQLLVDFTGTDAQSDGFVNCTFGGLRAAVVSAIGICLGWDLPWNDGLAGPLTLVAPSGTACTATFPTPVSMSTITPIILSLNATFAALSKMLLASERYREEAMANWCGTSLAPTTIGLNERGILTVSGETSHFAAGCGARTYADGVDTGGIVINTTASIPSVEAVESDYPVLYLMRRQLRDSGGPGRFRGGMAGEVALIPYHASGEVSSSFAGCGAEVPNAFGLGGGMPGAAARFLRFEHSSIRMAIESDNGLPAWLSEFDGTRRVTSLNNSQVTFPEDLVEYHNWQGGGGYGDPLEREPERVRQDVLTRAISLEGAEQIFGVVLVDNDVSVSATERLRQELRMSRLRRASPARGMDLDWVDQDQVPASTGASGLRYGDVVNVDFERDEVSCASCDARLSSTGEDFRRGCMLETASVEAAGEARGQDYSMERVRLLLFYCPGCARQLDCEVTVSDGGLRQGFILAG